jgi:hypothetical protein
MPTTRSFPPSRSYGCPSGTYCSRINQWYRQCVPGSGTGAAPGGGGSGGGTLNMWDQCGGKGGNCASYQCVDAIYPGQACPAGSSCQRLHEGYSQCRPAGSSYGTCEQVGGTRAWRGGGALQSPLAH